MNTAALFEVESLSRSFLENRQTVEALKDLTFRVPQNKIVAICGPSGAGKSTLLHILGLLDRDYHGSLRMQGVDLSAMTEQSSTRFRLERIGFVFQRHHVVDAMTVLENVAWPFWRLHGNRQGAYSRALQLLEEFGLAERAKHRPAKLSGGELQRAELARALVNGPAVVLADEPTAQLDESNAKHIIETLRSLRTQGLSVVVVTHDPNLAHASDIVLHMSYGRIVDLRGEPHAARE